jgi:hypothetical protein
MLVLVSQRAWIEEQHVHVTGSELCIVLDKVVRLSNAIWTLVARKASQHDEHGRLFRKLFGEGDQPTQSVKSGATAPNGWRRSHRRSDRKDIDPQRNRVQMP